MPSCRPAASYACRSSIPLEPTRPPPPEQRALVGLNKGEAHHALKRAINFHQRGELRDRTGEGQHYRVAGLNLLAAIIVFVYRVIRQ